MKSGFKSSEFALALIGMLLGTFLVYTAIIKGADLSALGYPLMAIIGGGGWYTHKRTNLKTKGEEDE